MPVPYLVPCFLALVLVTLLYTCTPCLAQEVSVPAPSEDAKLHTLIGYASYFWNVFSSIIVLLTLLHFGVSAKLRDFFERAIKKTWLQCVLYLLALTVCLHIAFLPQHYIINYVVPHYFKLSNQTFIGWFSDYGKHALLGMDGFVESFGVLFLVMRKLPKKWPILFCLYHISMVALNLFIHPTFVAPWFNHYTPMPQSVLRTKIEDLAHRSHFSLDIPVLIQDASQQTKTLNARVEGFGPSTRIVIWDNTMKSLPEDEIIAILAHEMGHYRLHHVYWEFALTALFSIVLVPINLIYADRFAKMLPPRWGIRDLRDWAITPALILVILVFHFVARPIENTASRFIENQADEYALQITGNGPAFARAMIALAANGLYDPNVNPFLEFWLFDHPAIGERVALANEYTRSHPVKSDRTEAHPQ